MMAFQLDSSEPSMKASLPWVSADLSLREEADAYRAVIAVLNPSWRVIVCRDAIQWIMQRRAGQRHGRARWEAKSFHRLKSGLMRRVRHRAGECDASALNILMALPAVMGGAHE